MEKKLFAELKKVQKMLWKDDDRMEQQTLFDLQDLMAMLIFNNASAEQQAELCKEFKHLYSRK
jgi:hypothetical protein